MLRIKKELNFDNYRDTNIQQLEIINFMVEKHDMKVFKGTSGKGLKGVVLYEQVGSRRGKD